MNNIEKIAAIKDGMKEEWYQIIVNRLEENRESTKDTLGVYPGKAAYDKNGELVEKGRIAGINYALDLPLEIVADLEKEDSEEESEKKISP